MELTVTPVTTELIYTAVFSEPLFDLFGDKATHILVRDLIKEFELKVNDLQFNRETLSTDFIHFSKFVGLMSFDVSYGLEQVTAILRNPGKEEHVFDLYSKLAKTFERHKVNSQQMNVHRQLRTEGDASLFLKNLNPKVPHGFEESLKGRGVFYSLDYPEDQLKIHITLVSSLFVEGGLYFTIENVFYPNKYRFEDAFRLAKERHDSIWKELKLVRKQEA